MPTPALVVTEDLETSAQLQRAVRHYAWSGGDPAELLAALRRDPIDVALVRLPGDAIAVLGRIRRLFDDVQVVAVDAGTLTVQVQPLRAWQADLAHAVWRDEVTIDDALIQRFAEASGDRNPVHLDVKAARAAGFPDRIAHGAWAVAHLSAVLGMHHPGPGTILLDVRIRFQAPMVLDKRYIFALFDDPQAQAGGQQSLPFVFRDAAAGTDCATGRAAILYRPVGGPAPATRGASAPNPERQP